LAEAPRTALRIVPQTQEHASKTEEIVKSYEKKIQAMNTEFRARAVFTTEPGFEEACKMLDKATKARSAWQHDYCCLLSEIVQKSHIDARTIGFESAHSNGTFII
jgi:hypothetical protein